MPPCLSEALTNVAVCAVVWVGCITVYHLLIDPDDRSMREARDDADY